MDANNNHDSGAKWRFVVGAAQRDTMHVRSQVG
jgi:hypothetical protein